MAERVVTLRELNRATLARQLLSERKQISPTALTTQEALAHLEREHGLTGLDARRAWRGARVRAHVLHHHETALWHGRPEGRFVAIEEPEAHVPVEARAEILRRYLAAFGPASRRDIVGWSMMHVPARCTANSRLALAEDGRLPGALHGQLALEDERCELGGRPSGLSHGASRTVPRCPCDGILGDVARLERGASGGPLGSGRDTL